MNDEEELCARELQGQRERGTIMKERGYVKPCSLAKMRFIKDQIVFI